jgi:DNA-binding Lrp family transcriptional regulator
MSKKGKTSFKLNLIDAKILHILLKDGRTGFDELANACKVTKNVAWKRFKALEKKGVIKGATVQINYYHFGFDALVTLLISVNADRIEQVMELMQKITEVRAFRRYYSVYNVRAFASLRDLNELDQIKQIIKQRVPTIGLKTYIWTGVRNIPENLNLTGALKNSDEKSQQNNIDQTVFTAKSEPDIDELDKQIMAKLASDGRASFTQIGQQIGVATETVIKRYHKLRESGSIKVSIQINPIKIGYSSILDFNIAFAAQGSFSNSVVVSLAKIPDIVAITRTSGDYDLQVTAMIRDISESFDVQDQIARISGIAKVEASARKITDRWPTKQQQLSTF